MYLLDLSALRDYNMTYKKFSRITLALIIVIFLAIVEYGFWHNGGYAKFETRLVAAGVVTGKYESDYACGSKGRYTCYARYLTIDNKNVQVEFDTFTSSYIGQYVTLTREVKVNDSGWNVLCIIIHTILWVVTACVLVLIFCQFIYWSVELSDKISLKTFYRNVWIGGK